jgi:predicted nicotinamide N-methyase
MLRSCTDCRSTGSVDRVGNSPWEVGSPVRLAERYPEEVRARPVVVAAVAAAVVVVAVAAAAGAQTVLSRHHATHYVYQNRRSAVGHMSHRSPKSRATDPPQANANQKENSPVDCQHKPEHIQ